MWSLDLGLCLTFGALGSNKYQGMSKNVTIKIEKRFGQRQKWEGPQGKVLKALWAGLLFMGHYCHHPSSLTCTPIFSLGEQPGGQ